MVFVYEWRWKDALCRFVCSRCFFFDKTVAVEGFAVYNRERGGKKSRP